MDGVPDMDTPVFFSLDPASTTVTAPTDDPFPGACTGSDAWAVGGDGVTPDDILVSGPLSVPGVPQMARSFYMTPVAQEVLLTAS